MFYFCILVERHDYNLRVFVKLCAWFTDQHSGTATEPYRSCNDTFHPTTVDFCISRNNNSACCTASISPVSVPFCFLTRCFPGLLLFLICLYHPTLDKGSFVGIETFPSLFPHKIVKRSVSFALCVTSSCVPNGRFPFLFFDILALPAQTLYSDYLALYLSIYRTPSYLYTVKS
jgi:hypothetical protein